VVLAERRLEAPLALIVHHEIRIGAAEIERVDRVGQSLSGDPPSRPSAGHTTEQAGG
jgi:hypothetical protein